MVVTVVRMKCGEPRLGQWLGCTTDVCRCARIVGITCKHKRSLSITDTKHKNTGIKKTNSTVNR